MLKPKQKALALLAFAVAWSACLRAAGEEFPPLPHAAYPLLASWRYDRADQARAAWRPMTGTPPADLVTAGRRNVLKLRCRFTGNAIDRASWDFPCRLDLAAGRGVQFQFFSPRRSPVAHFTFYFRSGRGWYSVAFSPRGEGWHTIRVAKADTQIEGRPDGWSRITGLRVSAWRGLDENTAIYLADLGRLGGSAAVAVVRGESPGPRAPAAGLTYAGTVVRFLDEAAVPYSLLSDLDLTPDKLARVRLAVLPHNPHLPEAAVRTLRGFLRRGGKLLVFHSLPAGLRGATKMSGGRYLARQYDGQFASIRFPPKSLAGAPEVVGQRSWNIFELKAGEDSRALAYWHDAEGPPTGHPAIVASDNCLRMSHVLLSDDAANKRRMLLAMVGHFVPAAWPRAAASAIKRIGAFGPYRNFDEAKTGLETQIGKNAPLVQRLALMSGLRGKAQRQATEGRHVQAIELAEAARREMLRLYCQVQAPQPGEFRGVWSHSPFGIAGWSWDRAIKFLADNGFTDIFANLSSGGIAHYPSKVLSVAADVAEKGDQLAAALAACRKYRVRLHVWRVSWKLGGRTPRPVVERFKRLGRLQLDAGGTPRRWLCPSHPENRKLEIESMLEIVRNYVVDGVHFDYMRYPGAQPCYDRGCRERFARAAGVQIMNWPQDVRRRGRLRKPWLAWRREQITRVVREVAQRARQIRPGVKISAAVFRHWPRDRDTVGQDWKLWCDRRYLDFVCPMDYTSNPYDFRDRVEQQVRWAAEVPCYPGIGFTAARPPMTLDGLIEQIRITRRLRTGGFMIFQYHRTSTEALSLLGLGLTRPR